MRLSKREAVLLIILLLIALVFAEYQLVYIPGKARLDELSAESQMYQDEADRITTLISNVDKVRQRKEDVLSDIDASSKRFLDGLNTDALLWNTYELLNQAGLQLNGCTTSDKDVAVITGQQGEIRDLTYQLKSLADKYAHVATELDEPNELSNPESKPEDTTKVDEDLSGQIEVYAITINAVGTYEQLRQFMANLEAQEKTISVTTLGINSSDESNLIEVEILISHYGVVKIKPDNDNVNIWRQPPYPTGDGDPFARPNIPPGDNQVLVQPLGNR